MLSERLGGFQIGRSSYHGTLNLDLFLEAGVFISCINKIGVSVNSVHFLFQ